MLRGPTAEHVARCAGYSADSAGTSPTSVRPLTASAIDRANRIVCMESEHLSFVLDLRPDRARDVEIWNIPDDYGYCAPQLIKLLQMRLPKKP